MSKGRQRKLTFEQAEAIRRLYAAGRGSIRDLARHFNVSRSLVHKIVRGEAYVKEEDE